MFKPSPSKPIEDYALIGDGHTAALVARDGDIDWLCWPRFDSDACLSALLGDERHGAWRLRPAESADVSRSYCGDTKVLQTEFRTKTGGVLRLTDFMPLGEDDVSAVIRRLDVREGAVEVELALLMRFGYGEIAPWFSVLSGPGGGYFGEVGPDLVVLRGPGLSRDRDVLRARITLRAGERADYILQHARSGRPIPDPIDPEKALARTLATWRGWISRFDRKTDWPNAVKRSLLTLKALTHMPSGSIVAAPTLGLPEKPGGRMNWDYRYCWLRDSSFTLTALLNAGFHDEAQAWLRWLLRAVAGAPDKMRVMYRVDGGRQLEEREIDSLPGWNGARPVRVGNAAAGQRQLDLYGEVLDSVCLCEKAGLPRIANAVAISARLVAHVERIWREPDRGMWESRGKPRHYVYSKAMAWVAVDRLLRLDDRCGGCAHDRRAELEALRDAIHADVCARGFDSRQGCFVQAYGSRRLDASTLLLALVGFLPATDERIAGTIAAVEQRLMEGGLVRREEAPWFGREEGVFLPCSCWLADCMAMQNRLGKARALFERVLALSSDLGLLSEEYHVPSRRLLGNFPQAMTHVAVINTALGLCGSVLQRGGG
jgi:GH15 family glucan-1,4-alpha-glucosidase